MRKLQIFSVPAATTKAHLSLVIYRMAQAVAHKARPHLTERGSAMQDGVVECARINRVRPLTLEANHPHFSGGIGSFD